MSEEAAEALTVFIDTRKVEGAGAKKAGVAKKAGATRRAGSCKGGSMTTGGGGPELYAKGEGAVATSARAKFSCDGGQSIHMPRERILTIEVCVAGVLPAMQQPHGSRKQKIVDLSSIDTLPL